MVTKMKKILVLLSLIFLFIAGLLGVGDADIVRGICNNISFETLQISTTQNINVVNEGVIQTYNLTEEHHILNKNENNNQFNFINSPIESHLGSINAKRMDVFRAIITLSHSNNVLNFNRVYLTQASPRAP